MSATLKNIIIAVTGASGAIYARQVVEMLLASGQVGRLALVFTTNGEAVSRYEGVGFGGDGLRDEVTSASGCGERSGERLRSTGRKAGVNRRQVEYCRTCSDSRDAKEEDEVRRTFSATASAAERASGPCAGDLSSDPRVEIFDNDDMFASIASGSARWDAMAVVPCSMGMLGRIASGVSDDLISRAADVMLKERRRLVLVPRETPLGLIHLRNMTAVTEAGAVVLPAAPSFYSRPGSVEELCATVSERVVSLLGVGTPGYEWKGL